MPISTLQSGSFPSNVAIDTDTLVVDGANNRVGVGTGSPSDVLHIKNSASTNVLIDAPTDNASLTLQCGSSDAGAEGAFVNFIQNTTSKWQLGMNTDNSFRLYNYNTTAEALQVDSSGNLLVGTTTNGTTADGTVIRASAETLMTRSNGAPLLLNRRGTDGAVIEVRNDNSAIGYITANASGMGVYLGGTAAANHLDDYEEGTWTPSPSSGSMATFNNQWYTKIGNLVTCSFYMYNFSGGTSNAQVMISGLPFAFKTSAEGFFQVGFVGGTNSLPTNTISITARIGQHGSNTFALYLGKVGNAYSNFQYSELGTGHYAATFSYQTA